MKAIKFILLGIFFGIVLTKSEVISWYRIQEMFRFQSIHMYGIIGLAVMTGGLGVYLIKKFKLRDFSGHAIEFADKEKAITKYLAGGSIFGLGWALTGACPGPLFINAGYGYLPALVAIAFALLGTLLYGLLKGKSTSPQDERVDCG